MATTSSSTSPAWSAAGTRLRSMAGWIRQLGGARLLHAAAVAVITTIAALAMLTAAARLYSFAVRHEASTSGAIVFTAAVLGLYTAITASGWRARLHDGNLPHLTWVLWWITVGVGLAGTAGAAESGTWVAQAINAAPMAALAAITALVIRPPRP